MTVRFALIGLLALSVRAAGAQVVLTADPHVAPYEQVQKVLGAEPETPDCADPKHAPHIAQTLDKETGRYVFVFFIHVTPDNDRCEKFDRQRNEIKTDMHSPDYLKGFLNDSVTFRWRFRLSQGFQPSVDFTHIHQIKAADGDDGLPIVTLTPRRGAQNTLEVENTDSNGTTRTLASMPLTPIVGEWVEVYERLTYGTHGSYSVMIRRVRDGRQMLSYASKNVDLWRKGTTMVRPKWGIYRSLKRKDQLRDEYVEFDRFCLAKGADDCAAEAEGRPVEPVPSH